MADGDRGHVITPRAVIARSVRHEPEFAPGKGWSYSNTNYLLAGLVIEAVTHRSAPAEIDRRILAPLRLKDTSFPVTDPEVHGSHLHGYDLKGRDMTRFSPSYDWTAGAMISTVDDLARFERALFGGKLLRPDQRRELKTPVEFPDAPAYGLGVQRMEVPCATGEGKKADPLTAWETDGAGPGYTSRLPHHRRRGAPTGPGRHRLRPRRGARGRSARTAEQGPAEGADGGPLRLNSLPCGPGRPSQERAAGASWATMARRPASRASSSRALSVSRRLMDGAAASGRTDSTAGSVGDSAVSVS
ncbi:serine hydrolase domain-containing protein [Streptomyces iranensis]|uniref:serine hydrolase domain-containing protein n=1 Tax=Streptomyces iranensis TaxID=576784 RepID=UPI0039B764D2